MSGSAACMVCRHTWVAVAPRGTQELECPKCQATKAYFVDPCRERGEFWECRCGCSVFHISRETGPYCVSCATPAAGWF